VNATAAGSWAAQPSARDDFVLERAVRGAHTSVRAEGRRGHERPLARDTPGALIRPPCGRAREPRSSPRPSTWWTLAGNSNTDLEFVAYSGDYRLFFNRRTVIQEPF
jgi:hypothetical protein